MRISLTITYLLLSLCVKGGIAIWTEEQGLSSNHITAITKDGTGLMWIGTARGLNTFDGYSFVSIERFRQHHINYLNYEPEADKLWVCSDSGLFAVSCKNLNEIVEYTAGCRYKNVCKFFVLQDRKYIVFSNYTVIEIDKQNKVKVVFNSRLVNTLLKPHQILSDGKAHIYFYVAAKGRLYQINNGSVRVIHGTDFKSQVTLLWCDESGLFISENKMRILLKKSLPMIDSCNIRGSNIDFFQPLNDNTSFFASLKFSNKMFMVDKVSGKVETPDEQLEYVLNGKFRTALFIDKDNILWIGTMRGLVKYMHKKERGLFEALDLKVPRPISTRAIIMWDTATYLVASYRGLLSYKPYTGECTILYQRPCRALLKSGETLYIGSETKTGLEKMNLDSKKIEPAIIPSKNSTDNNQFGDVLCLVSISKKQLLAGTTSGLYLYDLQSQKIVRYHQPAINHLSIYYIHKSMGSMKFWLGTSNGLYLLDMPKSIVRKFNDNTKPALSDKKVTFITHDPSGQLLVGTAAGGLNVFTKDLSGISYITKRDGLSSNEIYSVIPYSDSLYWISSYTGLSCYNRFTGQTVNYFKEDGLEENEFNQNSFLKVSDTAFYFGGINGIIKVNPSKESQQVNEFRIFASAINKWNQEARQFSSIPTANETIGLQPDENILKISLAGTDYRFPDRSRYFYQVPEIAEDWFPLSAYNPVLQLERLLPGTYHIQIKAINAKGKPSANTLRYTVKVQEPFYKSILFYIIITAFLSLGIYLYLNWKIRQIKMLQLLRMRIASNLHDEIGTLLTQITMWSDSLQRDRGVRLNQTDTLQKISSLSREVNANISDVLWAIDSRNDLSGSLTERMKEHADGIFESRDISFFIDSDEREGKRKISPDERQQLFLIFKEALNNIIKHSKADEVKISFRTVGTLELVINNNGLSGLGEKKGGQGVKNMNMRAQRIGASFSTEHSDSLFTVRIWKR